MIVGCFPHVIRCIQCIRVMIASGERKSNLLNFGKYLLSICLTITSNYNQTHDFIFWLWITLAISSSIYSFTWDIVMDWELFKGVCPLQMREVRIFKYKAFYLISVMTNFVLRLTWTFTISRTIVKQFIRPELFFVVLFTFEIFRRSNWNNFRVELQYIRNLKKYNVVPQVKFPFSQDELKEWTMKNHRELTFYDNQEFRHSLEKLMVEDLKIN